ELCELVDTTKLDRIWDSFEKSILYAAKKNIPHKKLKKGAPNNIRSNKFDKNSTSVILKKDIISLSRIYKSLKHQYKTTEATNLSENIVADFNHQVREINEKYRLEIMLSSDFSAEDSLAKIKGWWFILNKHWAAKIEKEKTKQKPFCKVSIDRVLSNINGEFLLSTDPKEVFTKTEAHFQQQFAKRQTKLEQ
ncbi:38228_t:CDS:2, partial [Gigaspora margarita]